MAEQNPKIHKWLDIGKRRFAEDGIKGIHIDEMSAEMGVAKTSFYFFFNSKEEFLNQLFAYWVVVGTDNLTAMVNQIEDPAKRFFALGKMIENNYENEFFYFQLKLYAKNNEHARPFLKEADDKRKKFSRKLFNDAGQSAKEVERNRSMMRVFFMGRMALMMGYDADPSYPEYSKDELLEMFGLNK